MGGEHFDGAVVADCFDHALQFGAGDVDHWALAPERHDDPAQLAGDVAATPLFWLGGIGPDRLQGDIVLDDVRHRVSPATVGLFYSAFLFVSWVLAICNQVEPAPGLIDRLIERDLAVASE